MKKLVFCPDILGECRGISLGGTKAIKHIFSVSKKG